MQLFDKLRNIWRISPDLSKIQVMKGTYISKDSTVGSYSYIGYNTFITKANIGRYCSIANNVSIGQGEHLIHNISTSSLFYNDAYNILTAGDCLIGNDVWIGVGCTVRRGIKIGNGAIIGANSFVNKDVPPFAIVGGIPAKILKYRFPEKDIEIIEKSSWWNFDITEAQDKISKVNEIINGSIQK